MTRYSSGTKATLRMCLISFACAQFSRPTDKICKRKTLPQTNIASTFVTTNWIFSLGIRVKSRRSLCGPDISYCSSYTLVLDGSHKYKSTLETVSYYSRKRAFRWAINFYYSGLNICSFENVSHISF
jgi:hypothetical protein